VTVAVVGAVRGVHVVAAGNEMRKQSMTCHPGIDDGDSLSGSARELPNLLQIEVLQLPAIGCVYPCGRRCNATLLLLGRSRWRGWAGFGQHRIVDRRRHYRERGRRGAERKGSQNTSGAEPYDPRDVSRHGRLRPRTNPSRPLTPHARGNTAGRARYSSTSIARRASGPTVAPNAVPSMLRPTAMASRQIQLACSGAEITTSAAPSAVVAV